MRQTHRAGEKLFIDYSGKKPRIVDRDTGEITEVELFVAVLGASNCTFAEATRTQQLGEFCASTVRALEYFGCCPTILVPDQFRSAVSRPDRYDPDINQTFNDLAQHYGMAVIPAPPRKPKGKAKVEAGVLIAQRWILARLRNRAFFNLAELNQAIDELLEELNHRQFKKVRATRRSRRLTSQPCEHYLYCDLRSPSERPLGPTSTITSTSTTATTVFPISFDNS
jgi:transposase